ncbi:hypothetical protein BBJ28_00014244 [Nothophytophthora sp. Chile5]|nr:hypothetical protein BBJ28_00014244 [Nothophytophthora sp. Chile5]
MSLPGITPPRPPVQLSVEEEQRFTEVATQLLDRTLRDLDEHDLEGRAHSDQNPRKWKKVHSAANFTTYTRRNASLETPLPYANADDGSTGSLSRPEKDVVLGVGYADGSLEDLMHGIFAPDSHTLVLTSLATHTFAGRCAVLAQIVGPTPADPFRFIGIKWVEISRPKIPILGLLVKPMDMLFVSACGTMTRPGTGEFIGYEIHHSVDLPGFPFVDGLKRTRVVSGWIYRQRVDGKVELFVEHYTGNKPGSLAGMLAIRHAASCVETVWKSCALAHMKKLRWCMDHQLHSDLNKALAAKLAGRCTTCHKELSKRHQTQHSAEKACILCRAPLCSRCRAMTKIVDLDRNFQVHRYQVVVCRDCNAFVRQQSATKFASQALMEKQKPAAPLYPPLTPGTLEYMARDYSLDNGSYCESYQSIDYGELDLATPSSMTSASSRADTESS